MMKCEVCGNKFEAFEHFVVVHKDGDSDVFMCEMCFFDLALARLNCESVQMDYDGINYHNPIFDLKDDD